MKRPPKLIPCFGRLSHFSKQTGLFSSILETTKQIKRFMDQNLSWVIVNRKQFQFLKSNLLSCYTPLQMEPSLTHPAGAKMVGTPFTKESGHCQTVNPYQNAVVPTFSIGTRLVELGLKDLV